MGVDSSYRISGAASAAVAAVNMGVSDERLVGPSLFKTFSQGACNTGPPSHAAMEAVLRERCLGARGRSVSAKDDVIYSRSVGSADSAGGPLWKGGGCEYNGSVCNGQCEGAIAGSGCDCEGARGVGGADEGQTDGVGERGSNDGSRYGGAREYGAFHPRCTVARPTLGFKSWLAEQIRFSQSLSSTMSLPRPPRAPAADVPVSSSAFSPAASPSASPFSSLSSLSSLPSLLSPACPSPSPSASSSAFPAQSSAPDDSPFATAPTTIVGFSAPSSTAAHPAASLLPSLIAPASPAHSTASSSTPSTPTLTPRSPYFSISSSHRRSQNCSSPQSGSPVPPPSPLLLGRFNLRSPLKAPLTAPLRAISRMAARRCRRGMAVSTSVAPVRDGVVQFEQTLELSCTLYCTPGPHHSLRFQEKPSTLVVRLMNRSGGSRVRGAQGAGAGGVGAGSGEGEDARVRACAAAAEGSGLSAGVGRGGSGCSEVEVGRHAVDLARLVPWSLQDTDLRPHTLAFPLSAAASGATLLATFGYELQISRRTSGIGAAGGAWGAGGGGGAESRVARADSRAFSAAAAEAELEAVALPCSSAHNSPASSPPRGAPLAHWAAAPLPAALGALGGEGGKEFGAWGEGEGQRRPADECAGQVSANKLQDGAREDGGGKEAKGVGEGEEGEEGRMRPEVVTEGEQGEGGSGAMGSEEELLHGESPCEGRAHGRAVVDVGCAGEAERVCVGEGAETSVEEAPVSGEGGSEGCGVVVNAATVNAATADAALDKHKLAPAFVPEAVASEVWGGVEEVCGGAGTEDLEGVEDAFIAMLEEQSKETRRGRGGSRDRRKGGRGVRGGRGRGRGSGGGEGGEEGVGAWLDGIPEVDGEGEEREEQEDKEDGTCGRESVGLK
ncbi:unnamed protein product [Closterium sp. Naga37s-1]|nr:unnamed protein product [Closterium sp. Naga37s-1]